MSELAAASSYQVFGVGVYSQIALTSNQVMSVDSSTESVSIRQGKVELPTSDVAQQIAACCFASTSEIWLDIPNLAKFQITERDIIVDAVPGADADLIQVYLQGYALGVQAMLAGKLVLHATTLSRNNRAIVLCGSSGSGKSTIAAALLAKGFKLVSDEITIIDQDGKVLPGFDDIKLWQDAVDVLKLPAQLIQPLRDVINKVYFRPEQQKSQPVRPAVVYVLDTDNRQPAQLTELTGFAKFEPLQSQYYRSFLVKPLKRDKLYLTLSGKHLGALPLVSVSRELNRLDYVSLSKLADAINQDAMARGVK